MVLQQFKNNKKEKVIFINSGVKNEQLAPKKI